MDIGNKRYYLTNGQSNKGVRAERIPELLNVIRKMLSSFPGVAFAYLYGSSASIKKGEKARFLPGDIDVGIYVTEGDPLKVELDLQMQFHKLTGLPPEVLDVRALNQAPLSVAIEIIGQGNLLLCTDEDVHTDFVESVSNRYRQLRGLIEVAYA